MRVCKKDGKWYTLDNRRLWVFRNLDIFSITTTLFLFLFKLSPFQCFDESRVMDVGWETINSTTSKENQTKKGVFCGTEQTSVKSRELSFEHLWIYYILGNDIENIPNTFAGVKMLMGRITHISNSS
uniref:Uncharacterized protein n=1 Tax=Magallana gigas TaxID=29159 RepID=K1Q797_MAGGI